MRNAVLTLCAGLSLLLVAGCAQQHAAVNPTPASYELPNIPEIERQHLVNAEVEGGCRRPRTQLVPRFEPAEPTPEEREILGPPPPEYVYLPYALRRFNPESRVYPRYGGAETAIHGTGGAEALYGSVYIDTRVYSAWGGAETATSSFGAAAAGTGAVDTGVSGVGGAGALRGGAETGIDSQPSGVARERRTPEP
jgi:hypothetical protein